MLFVTVYNAALLAVNGAVGDFDADTVYFGVSSS
jgi:hypothetical protein